MKPRLGGHVSAAGGLHNAFVNAERLGEPKTIQIFGASPRSWAAKLPDPEIVRKFKDAHKKSSVETVYLHAAYLVNLATIQQELREKSIDSLVMHLKIANAIGAEGLIFHLGSNIGLKNREEALHKIVTGMQAVLESVPGHTKLIMENSSGGGGKLGNTIEEIGWLMRHVKSKRVKVCLDTAHLCGAGVISEYSKAELARLSELTEKEIGLENLVAMHINDSKGKFASSVDRHENLGKGFIGLDGFRALAQEHRLHKADWILEVPGFEDKGPDKENLDILYSCFA